MRDRGGALVLGDGRRHMGLAKFGAELPCTVPKQYQAKPPQLCSSIVGVMLAAAWLRVLVRGGLCPDQGGGGLFNVNEHPARARTVGLIKRLAVLI